MPDNEANLQIDQSTPERVLVIAAHPDDIEFGVAGSVARWREAGAEITYCVITDGSAGSNEPGVDLNELARTREAEQRAAAEALGVEDVRLLGYKDGTLEATIDLRRELTRIVREVQPDRVVTQDPTVVFVEDSYVNHPDHRAAGEAAVYAVFPSAVSRPIFPELLDEGYEPHQVKELYLMLTLNPTHAIDISDVMDRKLESLMHHASQLNEEVGDWISEMNAEMGELAGVDYAEVYRVMRLAEEPHEAIEEAVEEAITGKD